MKSANKKIKALCFFDDDKGRDVEILMPVLYYAETYLNVEIKKAFIVDIDKIRRDKPDLVILANTIGSKNHHLIAKYAYENGIKVFALISEGNFRTNGTFNYWGYNTDKQFYQEYICHWSQRTLDFLSTALPSYKDKMVLTGATGFDRYRIYDFETKESFLKRYNLSQYKKVIGYAGWSFGKLHNPKGLMEIRNNHKENAEQRIKWMQEQQLLVENILRQTIENNPDILFILKRHPNEIHPHYTQRDNNEMINLEHYPNVLYLRNEEDVHTLISVSDIWTAFESTTTIEAWMMKDIPTLFINPDINFTRDPNYRGTVIVKSYDEFQEKINEFYATGKVEAMYTPEKTEARKEIIKNVIGFDDGFNHIRAGYYLTKTIETINPKSKKSITPKALFLFRYFMLHLGHLFYYKPLFLKLPRLKKNVWIMERYKLKNIEPTKTRYYRYLDRFHKQHDIPKKLNDNNFWKKIIQKEN